MPAQNFLICQAVSHDTTRDIRGCKNKVVKTRAEGLTFSSACSTPVAIWISEVRDSYSLASIWSSRRTGRGVFVLNFLTRTFRVAMVVRAVMAAVKGPKSDPRGRKRRVKSRSSHQ